MGHTWKRKQWHMWFACLAILLNALSPSLSYAFASLQANANGAAIEICSASGAVYTQADLAPAAASTADSALHHIEHCPFCMNHAGSAGLPPSTSPLAIATGRDWYPPLFYQAPAAQFAWLGARPRGPPPLA